ncbi:O-antigen ligase [Ectothiorhodospira magna]|uniref:O-antigen ligase n=1 Tax=Ectothiorhodospira magna TaxID=867345 RepID=A0A1H9BHV6_9GAMM|nr:O-antigen ligase family protein [Ectothiorhodospira magna]SEP88556.1 O-antigen ligase [Ectothiorhodospira magna]
MSETTTGWADRVGVGGIYLFAAFAWSGPSPAALGLSLTCLAFLVQMPRAWPVLMQIPAIQMLGAVLLFLILHSGVHVWLDPGAWQTLVDTGISHAQWLLPTVAVLWFLAGQPRRVMIMLTLACLSLLVRLLYNTHWPDPLVSFFGPSHGFGMAQIALGLYLATALLGLALFMPRLAGWLQSRWQHGLVWWLLTGLILLFAQALMVTQSRATWLAFLLVAPVTLVLFFHRHRPGPAILGMLGAGLMLPLVLILWLNGGGIQERVAQEADTLGHILALETAQVATDSVGLRYHVNLHGLTLAQEHPLWGWGGGSSGALIATHPVAEVSSLQHFHNTYLQILVEFGLVGLGLALMTGTVILLGWWRLYQTGELPRDLYFLLLGASAMALIWSLSNVRLEQADMRAYGIMLLASGLTFHLARYR